MSRGSAPGFPCVVICGACGIVLWGIATATAWVSGRLWALFDHLYGVPE